MTQWPPFFPAPDCPPADAIPAEYRVFRLVRGESVTREDLIPWREEFPDRDADDECLACGLSVYDDRGCLVRLRKRVSAFRNRNIAVGVIGGGNGLSKPTPSNRSNSHRTWWIPAGMDPLPLFGMEAEVA